MKERALKWVLRLLGIALLIGPILVAFSMNNWDLRQTVLPSESEMSQVSESVSGLFGGGISQNPFEWQDPIVTGTTIRLPVKFTSPFNAPIKITDISATVSDQGVQIAELRMEEDEVEVSAKGTANFTLAGSFSGMPPVSPQFSRLTGNFEMYGLTVQIQMSGM